MEITTRILTAINTHRATIRTPLDEEKILDLLRAITTPQVSRIGRAFYAGQYPCTKPFTGIVTPKRIDIYCTTPFHEKDYLRIRGRLKRLSQTELRLSSGNPLNGALNFVLVVVHAALVLWIMFAAESSTIVIYPFLSMAVIVLWTAINGTRRRDAFRDAVAEIGAAIAEGEPESDMPGEPGRAVSSRKR